MKSIVSLNKISVQTLFILVVLFSLTLSIVSKLTLITEDMIIYSFRDQLSSTKASEIYSIFTRFTWFSIIVIPFTLSIKIVLVSVIIYIGTIIMNSFYNIKFRCIIKTVLVSEVILIIGSLIKFLHFFLSEEAFSIQELTYYYPLSLISLLDVIDIKPIWIFPLCTLNIFHLVYIISLSIGLSQYCNLKRSESDKIIMVSYLPGIALWILIVMFLTN